MGFQRIKLGHWCKITLIWHWHHPAFYAQLQRACLSRELLSSSTWIGLLEKYFYSIHFALLAIAPAPMNSLLWTWWSQASDVQEWIRSTGAACIGTEKKASDWGLGEGGPPKQQCSHPTVTLGPCPLSFWILWLREARPCLESPFWV